MREENQSIIKIIIKRFLGSFASAFGFLMGFLLITGVIVSMSLKQSLPKTFEDRMLLKVSPNKEGRFTPLQGGTPLILKIDIEGIIMQGKRFPTSFATIKNILQQPIMYGISQDRIKGILLNINSPGGDAADTDNTYQLLMEYKKKHNLPIHAITRSVCASGGYYLACTSDVISTQEIGIVGSVGVRLAPNFNFYKLMEKIGIDATIITAGKNKIAFPAFTPNNKDPKAYQDYTNVANFVYDRFLTIVSKARESKGLTKSKLVELGATIYSSKDAKKLGYIDHAGINYDQALEALVKELKIDDQNYQVISFEKQENFLNQLQAKTELALSGLQINTRAPYSLEMKLAD